MKQRKYGVKVLLEGVFQEDECEIKTDAPILPPTPRNIKRNPKIFGPDYGSPRSTTKVDKEKRTDESELVHEVW